ncbi:MAG: hypothetical protein J5857_01285 [Treponema sp.]|nr:hypothetical protein [Treponema sp.]
MRKIALSAILVLCLVVFASCKSEKNLNVAGKTYLYEKEGFGDGFRIQLRVDGTFVYYEGALSSYIGMGTWKTSGNILTMHDGGEMGNPHFKNNFIIEENRIIWQEKDSTNFLYLKISDGDSFWVTDDDSGFPFDM